MVSILACSCSEDETTNNLTKNDILEHLKNKNKNFVILDSVNLSNYKTNIPEPIHFETLEQMDLFLDQMNSVSGSSTNNQHVLMHWYDNSNDAGGSNSYYIDKRYIGGFGVFINIGLNINYCQGSNLSSWISGFTLGVSYTHNGGTINNNQNSVNYNANGILNYNIIIEGIGTIFSENVSYSGTYRCN